MPKAVSTNTGVFCEKILNSVNGNVRKKRKKKMPKNISVYMYSLTYMYTDDKIN